MKEKNDFCIQFPGVPQRIRIGKQKFSSQKKGRPKSSPSRVWIWIYLNSDLTTWLTILATSLGISLSFPSYTTLENV
jgi:hypothetical protein